MSTSGITKETETGAERLIRVHFQDFQPEGQKGGRGRKGVEKES